MSRDASDPTIEEILARVRAETVSVETAAPVVAGRRQGIGTIPLVAEPDDGDKIAIGRPFYSIEEFAALDDEDFLRNAYRVVLGREIDGVGRGYYLPAMRQGHIGVVRILSALSRSAEGKARGVKIRWLMPAAVLDRLAGLPVVGKFFEPFMRFLVRSTTNRRLSVLSERHHDLILEVNAALSAVRKNQAGLDMRMTLAEQDAELTKLRMEEAVASATNALSDNFLYDAPVFLQLDSFDQIQVSVFQLTRSPGKKIVYLGSLLLVLGIFSMFYVRERRLWLWLKDTPEGGSSVLMAVSTTRRTLDFEKEFARTKAEIDEIVTQR